MGLFQQFWIELKQGAKEGYTKAMQDAAAKGGDAAAKETEKSATRMMDSFKRVAGALGIAFGVKQVVDFAKASIAAAAESEHGWAALRQTLDNMGVSFDKVGANVAAMASKIQDSTRFDDEAVVRGFNTLLQMTGDYTKSLNAIGPIADFAAAKQISFEQASTIVGKALAGNTVAFKKLVPEYQKGGDVIQALGKFHGQAAADMGTFAGGLEHTKNMYGELQEVVGQILIQGGEEASVMKTVGDAISGATKWVTANKDELAHLAGVVAGVVVKGIQMFISLIINTARELEGLVHFVGLVGASFVDLEVTVLKGVVALRSAGAAIAEALGQTEKAAQLRTEVAGMKAEIAGLEKWAADKRKPIGDSLAGGPKDAAASTKTSASGMKTDLEGAFTDASTTGKTKMAELSAATQEHMRDMSAAYAASGKAFDTGFTGSILRGKDATLAAYKEITTAGTASTETLRAANEAAMSSYINVVVPKMLEGRGQEQAAIHAERDAVQELQDKVHAGQAQYTDEYVPDVLKGSNSIQDSLHATAAAEEGVTTTFRGGEQYYVNQHIPAILAGQGKVQEELHKTGTTSTDASTAAKTGWLDAANAVNGAITGLGKIFGGVFASVSNAIGTAISGFNSVAAAIKIVQGAGTGLISTLGKIAAAAGALGGIIGIVSAAIPIISGILPGKHTPESEAKANQLAYEKALKGDLSALDFLLQKSPKEHGGGGGWQFAESEAQAYALYLRARGALGQPQKPLGPPPTTQGGIPGGGLPGGTGGTGGGLVNPGRPNNPYGYHSGGVVGDNLGTLRKVNPLLFANAIRMHGGGMIAPDERPIIAKVGESILPKGVPALDVTIQQYGVSGDNVTQKTVNAINDSLSRMYQKAAKTSGNARM